MGTYSNFDTLCSNLYVDNRELISKRNKSITKRLNTDFYSSDSETYHSRYVGSYGRDTAIKDFHDLDVLFEMPIGLFPRYNDYSGNGQSALLQAVRTSLLKTYWNTDIGGDGQVVVVNFSDSMRFEVLPAFRTSDVFLFPDSNKGGSWKVTDPLSEISAIQVSNNECNKNLKRLCRMARAWRRNCNVPINGLLIDTLAERFLMKYEHRKKSYTYYDWMIRDFLLYLSECDQEQSYWLAVGSHQYVYRKGVFEHKAKRAYNIAVEAIKYDDDKMPYTAAGKWRDIFGNFYPNPS